MSNELTVPTTVANLAPRSFPEAVKFAEMLANSSFVPRDFRGKPAEIIGAIQFGFELGVGPMQALQNIAVINGKPSIYGDLALALVQASGLMEYIQESDDGHRATCKVKRKGYPEHVVTFSDDDAKRAGLLGKSGPWTQYPATMRKFRARGFALRDQFADVLKGLITREEAQDYPAEPKQTERVDESTGEVVNATAPADLKQAMPVDSDLASAPQRAAFWKMVQRVKGDGARTWLENRCIELNGSPDGKKLTVGQIKTLTEMLQQPEDESQEPPQIDDDLAAGFDAEQEKAHGAA